MKINVRTVWQMTADGLVLLEQESIDYAGPIAAAKGGSDSRSSSRSAVSTQNLNLQEIDGVAVAGVDGSVSIETTDEGTVAAAHDIAVRGIEASSEGFQEAADVASDAIDAGVEQTGAVLEFATTAQRDAFDFAGDVAHGFEDVVRDVIDFAGGTGEQVIDATERIQARESGNTDARLQEITRVALIGAAVVAGGALFLAAQGND